MKGYFLFFALSSVLATCLTLSFHYGILFLCLLFFVRVFLTKHKQVIKWTVLCFLVSVCISLYHQATKKTILTETNTHFIIDVSSQDVVVNGASVQMKAKIKQANQTEEVRVILTCQTEEEKYFWEWLDNDLSLEVEGNLYPYALQRNFNQFDERKYMAMQRNSFFQLKVNQYTLRHYSTNYVTRWLNTLKKHLPNKTFAYLSRLLFGKKDDDSIKSLQVLGITHLFVYSGFHIHFLLKVLSYGLKRIGSTETIIFSINRIIVLLCILLSPNNIGLYKLLILSCFPKEKKIDKLCCLLIGFIWCNPYIVYTLFFQFSFLLAIIYSLTKSKLAVWLFSIPLISYHFFEINWLSYLLSSVLFYFVGYYLLPLFWFIAIAIWIHPSFVSATIFIHDDLLHQLDKLFEWLATLKWTTLVTGRLPIIHYTIILFLLCVFYKQIQKRWRLLILTAIFFLLLPPTKQRFVMIDVGQGSAFLFQMGKDVVLYDTGGDITFQKNEAWKIRKRKSLGNRVLIPTLKSLGISRINTVILSHQDSDHSGALDDLKKEMAIQNIVYGKGANIKGTQAVTAPHIIQAGDIKGKIIYPFQVGQGKNDDSLIFWLHFGERTFLFMGDSSKQVERTLLKHYPNLKADIIQIGHHGSKTSTDKTFINAIEPSIALISVGENNVFHHPNEEVLFILKDTKIYRTDKQGAVSYEKRHGAWVWQSVINDTEHR